MVPTPPSSTRRGTVAAVRYRPLDPDAPLPRHARLLLSTEQPRESPWRIPDDELREMALRLAGLIGPQRALCVMADVLAARRRAILRAGRR